MKHSIGKIIIQAESMVVFTLITKFQYDHSRPEVIAMSNILSITCISPKTWLGNSKSYCAMKSRDDIE